MITNPHQKINNLEQAYWGWNKVTRINQSKNYFFKVEKAQDEVLDGLCFF